MVKEQPTVAVTRDDVNPLLGPEAAIDRVLSKFTAFDESYRNSLDSVIKQAASLNQELLEDNNGESDLSVTGVMIFEQLVKKVRDVTARVSSEHRDMHTSVSKVGKEIEKSFTADLTGISRKEEHYESRATKRQRINSLIAEKLLSQGLMDVAEKLEEESGVVLADRARDRDKFQTINSIMDSLRHRNLKPALDWCDAHAEELKRIHSDLAFNLRKLQFVQLLQNENRSEALAFAKQLQPYAEKHAQEVQLLMGALLYGRESVTSNNRYSHLGSDVLWMDIGEQFARDACVVQNLPYNNPLTTVLNAGCRALPQLLALRQVIAAQVPGSIWGQHNEELPIEIDLGNDHTTYHSVFTCPILRQQTTEHNPPMRLACGHVISKDALTKLAVAHRLKCPYCPHESMVTDARQVYF